MTLKTVYQTEEGYSTAFINIPSMTASRMALKTFIEKNMAEIILCTRHDSFHKMIRSVGLKKDKT
jgi:hypothetical protein